MIFTQEMLESMKKVEAAREQNIAYEPRRLTAEEKASAVHLANVEAINALIDTNFVAETVTVVKNNVVSIITGGPGTGKTTIIKCVIDILKKREQTYVLAAPTGRAAKRITEILAVAWLEIIFVSKAKYINLLDLAGNRSMDGNTQTFAITNFLTAQNMIAHIYQRLTGCANVLLHRKDYSLRDWHTDNFESGSVLVM